MKIREARHGLGKLMATAADSHHKQYTVECDCGLVVGATFMSHKPGGYDLSPYIQGQMSKGLSISREFWRGVVSCRYGRADYLKVIGHGHTQ